MALMKFLCEIPSRISGMFYVNRCIGCDKPIKKHFLCRDCAEAYFNESIEVCQGCGKSFPFCRCAIDYLSGSDLIYALPYKAENSVTREMILFFKERKHKGITEELAERTNAALNVNGEFEDYLLTYIPRSRDRKTETGVDQTKELALIMAKKTKLPLIKTIHCRETHQQQKFLSRRQRDEHANIRFVLRRGAEKIIKDKNIILLDDVVTSGASMKRCAELLRRGGAKKVVCIASARSVKYL